jgi:hypothetical protein
MCSFRKHFPRKALQHNCHIRGARGDLPGNIGSDRCGNRFDPTVLRTIRESPSRRGRARGEWRSVPCAPAERFRTEIEGMRNSCGGSFNTGRCD